MAKVFLDTNVIVYANDARDAERQARAIDVVSSAIRDGSGVVSTQVLQEYAVVAATRLEQHPDAILGQLLQIECMEVVVVTPALIRRSLELQLRYHVGYWDASILAAAEHASCPVLFSEDLNAGELYTTVRVENSFLSNDV